MIQTTAEKLSINNVTAQTAVTIFKTDATTPNSIALTDIVVEFTPENSPTNSTEQNASLPIPTENSTGIIKNI